MFEYNIPGLTLVADIVDLLAEVTSRQTGPPFPCRESIVEHAIVIGCAGTWKPEQPMKRALVRVLARHLWIHVREGAARVRLPGPHMQLVERAQAITIGAAGEAEQLAFQRCRSL